MCWVLFTGLFAAGYKYQPEMEDPSIVITAGALLNFLALSLFWIVPRAGTKGDCPEFSLCMIIAFACRLAVTTRYQGYLPTDVTGDGLYQLLEALTAICAFRGLVRTGITQTQLIITGAVLGVACGAAYQCYGFLNRREWADRSYAVSVYTECLATLFLAYTLVSAGKDRDVRASFLIPMSVSAAFRTYFWYLAMEEIVPTKPELLMEYFPQALVIANVCISIVSLFTFLLVALTPAEEEEEEVTAKGEDVAQPFLQAPVAPVFAAAPVAQPMMAQPMVQQMMAQPMATPATVVPSVAGLPSLPAPEGSGCKEFAPLRAVYEGGVLRVQYQPVY